MTPKVVPKDHSGCLASFFLLRVAEGDRWHCPHGERHEPPSASSGGHGRLLAGRFASGRCWRVFVSGQRGGRDEDRTRLDFCL